MTFRKIAITFTAIAFSTAWPTVVGAQTLPTYHVTELSSPTGDACSATALNDAGVVAGSCPLPAGAVVWHGGQPSTFGVLQGGTFASPAAINAVGTIAGAADFNFSARTQPFVQTPGGLVDFDPISGGNAFVVGMMDNGTMFGDITKSLSGNTASWDVIMWTADASHPGRYKETLLPHFPGGASKFNGVYASRSNKVGQVVGWVTTSVIGQQGGFWNNDAAHSVVALQPLPGGGHSIAWGINDIGQAVGESDGAGILQHATLWQNDPAHVPMDLGVLPGDTISTAIAANSLGQVVGVSASGNALPYTGQRAFLYTNGVMADLATLIDPADGFWTIPSVAAINNAGQIVASGTINGRSAALLLTPIQ